MLPLHRHRVTAAPVKKWRAQEMRISASRSVPRSSHHFKCGWMRRECDTVIMHDAQRATLLHSPTTPLRSLSLPQEISSDIPGYAIVEPAEISRAQHLTRREVLWNHFKHHPLRRTLDRSWTDYCPINSALASSLLSIISLTRGDVVLCRG